jgi:cytochrome c biogenesis protein
MLNIWKYHHRERTRLTKNKSALWSFFSSVQLAIVLIALIALFAVIGTIVPQREAAAELARTLSPGLFSFLQTMQIFDLYHSLWFYLLLALLTINLTVCSLDRFPLAWRRFRLRPSPQNEDIFKNLPEENVFPTSMDSPKAADIAAAVLKKSYRNCQRGNESQGIVLCAEKGRFAVFGVYIVHLSILVLIAGVIIGSVFGLEGNLNINEGETANTFILRNGKLTMPLPFDVRCDKFILELYENGAPKKFQSDLTFLRNNQVIYSGKLLVNHPVTVEGYRFYQASYGAAPEGKATLALWKSGRRDVINVAKGYQFELPGKEGTFTVLRVEENLMQMGPAIKVAVRSAKEEVTFWVFQNIDKIREMNPGIIEQVPMFNPGLFHPYTFTLLGLEEKYFTGLQVSRDPGTPVLAFAAALLISGLMLVLFSYSRQVWIRIEQKKEQSLISVAGRSYKNKSGLEHELRHLLAELKDKLENSP